MSQYQITLNFFQSMPDELECGFIPACEAFVAMFVC